MSVRRLASAVLSLGLVATPVAAQDRPFVFSVSTADAGERRFAVHFDTGMGEAAFAAIDGDAQQQIGMRATFGTGVILLARVGVSPGSVESRTSQQAEFLYSPFHARAPRLSLAMGMGLRHEAGGVNVLTGRIVAGRRFESWRIDGNALLERPLSVGRDAIDLITSVGVSKNLWRPVYVGVEMIGEDLEGFWEPNEAEGGARLLIGPSMRVAPPGAHWQVTLAGGRVMHATRTSSTSGAERSLGQSARDGYALRVSLSYGF